MTKAKQNPARKTGGKSRKKTPDKGKLPRRIFAAIFLILAVWCMLPVFAGIFNIGIWLASPIFLVCAVLSLYFKKIDRRLSNKIIRAVYRVISGALLLTVIIFVALSFVMVYYIHRRPAENATVIVPGCQIIGRSPSPMLRYRLEAALRFLNENPGSACVVSGAQGDDEQVSEASVMREWLIENDIAPERIYIEDKSFNTYENIENSLELIKKEGLPEDTAIASDGFHQTRCQLYADRFGGSSGALEAYTNPVLVPGYWMRDLFGVAKIYVMGK